MHLTFSHTRSLVLCMFLFMAMVSVAQDFLSTRTVTYKNKAGKMSYSASVEFPTAGKDVVVESILEWMGVVLDTDGDFRRDYDRQLRASCDSFINSGQGGEHTILIERSYEDERLVTFESMVTDKKGTTWRWADCASFSKRDGHRITIDEIFDCSETDISHLMWDYRGDLPLDGFGPDDLMPVNAGFIDGWIIVIGPARNYTGAPFRLRYEEIEDFLSPSLSGYYH